MTTLTEIGNIVAKLSPTQSMDLACLFCKPAEIAGFMPAACAEALAVTRLYVAGKATEAEFEAAKQSAHKEYLQLTGTNGWSSEGQAAGAACSAMLGMVVEAYRCGIHASSKAASHFKSDAMWLAALALDKILSDYMEEHA